MQAKNHDGSYGDVMPYDQNILDGLMKRPEVKHVEVFEGTPEEIARRQKMRNNLKVKKRYQKNPKNRNRK